jgi:hypothetical protein
VIVAVTRPDSWAFPLFLHVLGAMTLAGAMATVTVLAVAGIRRTERDVLARATFWASLAVAVPAWIVMRAAAEWIYSKEPYNGHDDPNWLGVGFVISDLGLPILLLMTGFAYWWSRRADGWQGWVVVVLAPAYLALLAVAWWVMSAKPSL